MQRILPFFLPGLLCAAGATVAAEPQKPNILLFYADDLGYGELGCYGFQEVRPPRFGRGCYWRHEERRVGQSGPFSLGWQRYGADQHCRA
jgi:hypothetical protein